MVAFATGAPRGPIPPRPPDRPGRAAPPPAGRPAAMFWPLYLGATLLPLLLFAAGAWWSWAEVRDDAGARISRTVQMLQEHALRAFETQETVITAVEAAARGLDWEAIAGNEELHGTLRALERGTSALSGIGLVRPDGRMVAVAAAFPFAPVNVGDREYFRANSGAPALREALVGARSGSVVGEVVLSRPRDVPVFSLSRARRDAEGGFDGVIVTAFTPEYFSDFYAQIAESPTDTAVLFRLDGALLARTPAAPDWGVRATQGTVLALARREPGPALVTTRSAVDGVERLYAVHRLENYPVAVAYGLDTAVLRRAWLNQIAALGAACLLAAALLLGLTARVAVAARNERAEAERRAAAEAARADAEAALRQAQRLEALGQLAAGVAHDFRNTVQAVQGGVRLIRSALDTGETDRARSLAAMVAEAAGRGAALTERMLAVARRGREGEAAETDRTDPAEALREACELLRPTLGGDRRLHCELAPGLPARVRGDRAELEAAIINLAINARDATTAQGEIRIAATAETVRSGPPHPAGLAPGHYARVTVADDGAGMDAETLARATEAFFTTKPMGQGTGLGLATARAFAEGAGGALRIESSPGRGTTVILWLPEAAAA